MSQTDADSPLLTRTAKTTSDQHGFLISLVQQDDSHKDKVTDDMSCETLYHGGAVSTLYLVGFITRNCTLREEARWKVPCLTRMW